MTGGAAGKDQLAEKCSLLMGKAALFHTMREGLLQDNIQTGLLPAKPRCCNYLMFAGNADM